MIYYLAHPWSNNPEESFTNAVEWTFHLRVKGLFVFSPILHTHPYWKTLHNGSDAQRDYIHNEDWLVWDLTLLGGFKEIIVLMSKTAFKYSNLHFIWLSQGCKQEYDFAKEHQILVLELEAFLDGREEEL